MKAARDWRVWVGAMMVLNVISFGLSWTINTHAAQRAVDSAERERAAQSQANKQVVCAVVTAQEAVYAETPSRSETGKNAAQAWHDLHQLFQC